jgi:hypothetical protein
MDPDSAEGNMITVGDIQECGKIERHSFDGSLGQRTYIGVKIDLSKDKWALLELNGEESTVSWRLFEKNWTLAKKPYCGPCSEGDVLDMHDGCYPMGIGTETQKRNLWEYCDNAERSVLIMHPLFHMDFRTK